MMKREGEGVRKPAGRMELDDSTPQDEDFAHVSC